MEDQLDLVANWIKVSSTHGLPTSPAGIVQAVKSAEPTREFFVRKLRQILRKPLQHGGAFVRVAGRDGRLVKLRLPLKGDRIPSWIPRTVESIHYAIGVELATVASCRA